MSDKKIRLLERNLSLCKSIMFATFFIPSQISIEYVDVSKLKGEYVCHSSYSSSLKSNPQITICSYRDKGYLREKEVQQLGFTYTPQN